MDVDEARMIKESDNVHLVKSYEYSLDKLKEVLPKLKDNVFITIDVDVFDPSFIRNTGTPEPGGMIWNEMIDALALIFKEKKVIGADIVEFAPKVNFESEAYALAKLVYKMCNLSTVSHSN
jgi:agmatinase